MHNRQSGAAHVPIMFFLILLVMFLGALGFGFVTQTKNSELLQERNKARSDLAALQKKELLIEHYIADIGKVIGKPGKYEGREGSAMLYEGATLTYEGLMSPKEIKQVMDDAAGGAQVSTGTSLENVFGAMVTKINTLNQRIRDIETERDKALADKSETDGKFATATAENAAASRSNAQNLEQTRSDFESAKSDKDKNITTLQNSLRAKADELTTAKEEALAREKDLKGQIGLLKTQLSALIEKSAMQQPPHVPDGKIQVAKNGIPTAFINLGRKDMLMPGTIFRVQAANSSKVKGYAQVTRVEDEKAEVRLYDFVDPIGDYAGEGDLLYNDLYTPRVTRTIYLMGRFGVPGKEQLTLLLKRLGNRVVSKMGPGVDTVVLGNDPVNEEGDGFASIQESEEFKLANELRVEFTYLAKIADLIKL